MEWNQFYDWIIKALMTGLFSYGVHILGELKKSVDLLNERVSTVIERTEWHNKSLEKLDERVSRLELHRKKV